MAFRVGDMVKLNHEKFGRLNGRIGKVVYPPKTYKRVVPDNDPVKRDVTLDSKGNEVVSKVVHSRAHTEYVEVVKVRLRSDGSEHLVNVDAILRYEGRS